MPPDPPAQPAQTLRRRIAVVVALVGVAVVGGQMARTWPRQEAVLYQLRPDVTRLEVDYLLNEEAVVSVRYNREPTETRPIRHVFTGQPGRYDVRITTYQSDGRSTEHHRLLVVPAEGEVRFDLRR